MSRLGLLACLSVRGFGSFFALAARRGLSKLQAAGKSAFCPTTIEMCKRVSQILIVRFQVKASKDGWKLLRAPIERGSYVADSNGEVGEEIERLVWQSHLLTRPTRAVDSGTTDRSSAPKIAFFQSFLITCR